MTQPYPDPPISSTISDQKSGAMSQIWWRWFTGLLRIVNRLSVGLGVSGIVPLAAVTPGGTVGSLTIQDGAVTKIVPPT